MVDTTIKIEKIHIFIKNDSKSTRNYGERVRIWSIHPSYLDTKGLVALWRETLLAQNVLLGKTKGYRNHPQLNRFKATTSPPGAIAEYLLGVADEADKRGYNFKREKIIDKRFNGKIPVTKGQMEYEFKHLMGKLEIRDPERFILLQKTKAIKPHPIFKVVEGEIEDWEIT